MFQYLDWLQCVNSYSSTAFMPSVLNKEISEIRVGPWGVYKLSELFKAESTATKPGQFRACRESYSESDGFSLRWWHPISFPERVWKSRWLVETLFSKGHTDRSPYSHWCLLQVKAKKIPPKAMLSSAWREFLSVKINATFLHTPSMYAIGIISENCCVPPMCTGNWSLMH